MWQGVSGFPSGPGALTLAVLTTCLSLSSGHQPTKPVATFAAAVRPRPQDPMAIEGSPREQGLSAIKRLQLSHAVSFIHIIHRCRLLCG